MNRKIIQIATAMGGIPSDPDTITVALCDDGTVWRSWNGDAWKPMPMLPQNAPRAAQDRAAKGVAPVSV